MREEVLCDQRTPSCALPRKSYGKEIYKKHKRSGPQAAGLQVGAFFPCLRKSKSISSFLLLPNRPSRKGGASRVSRKAAEAAANRSVDCGYGRGFHLPPPGADEGPMEAQSIGAQFSAPLYDNAELRTPILKSRKALRRCRFAIAHTPPAHCVSVRFHACGRGGFFRVFLPLGKDLSRRARFAFSA